MEDQILNFPNQLAWEPVITNSQYLKPTTKFIVCGMGGSALPASVLKVLNPRLDLLIYRDYGLPRVPDYFLKQSLVIVSSHSGNTEETLSVIEGALTASLQVAVITTGGQLLELAQKHNLPYIQYPGEGIQPRVALGYGLKSLAALTGDPEVAEQVSAQALTLQPALLKTEGEKLAQILSGKIPLIYSSALNGPLGYIWKIKFNETAKIPAFYNVLPELNHNELNGMEQAGNQFAVILLKDAADNPRIGKRAEVLKQMYQNWGIGVYEIELDGSPLNKAIKSSLLADWVTYFMATAAGRDPIAVSVVEEFKKLINQ